MSTQATKRDVTFAVDDAEFHLGDYCPYLSCGERVNGGEAQRFCGQCGFVFNVCSRCRATNRLLASFCRGCSQVLESTSWPIESGLRSDTVNRGTIRSLGSIVPPFPVRLGATVDVSPIAADGLILIAQSDRRVSLLSEHTGEMIGHIPFTDQVVVTPALRAGTFFAAAGRRVYAFDLTEFIDQPSFQHVAPMWARDCEGDTVSQPLLIDEHAVYVVSRMGPEARLEAISQYDGQTLWAAPLKIDTQLTSAPVLLDGQLLIVKFSGDVVVVDCGTGQETQAFSLNRSVDPQVSPFVSGKRVILADPHGLVFELLLDQAGPLINGLYSNGSRVSAISASEQFIVLCHMAGVTLLSARGNFLWSSDTMESVSASAIIAGESVVAIDDSGNGLLFNTLKSNPTSRVKLLTDEVGPTPIMTTSNIIVVSSGGSVVAVNWTSID